MQNRLDYRFWLLCLGLLCACAPPPSPDVLIDAVIYDGFELANRDEGVVLYNRERAPVDISGWQLTDGDSGTAVFPPNTFIPPLETLWVSKNGSAFSQRYRHVVDFELQDSHPLVDNLTGTWPGLTDAGDEIMLLDSRGNLVDMLVFKMGEVAQAGWEGTAVHPLYVEEEGLFLHRLRTPDTDSAADWQHATYYPLGPRKVGANSRIGANLEVRR